MSSTGVSTAAGGPAVSAATSKEARPLPEEVKEKVLGFGKPLFALALGYTYQVGPRRQQESSYFKQGIIIRPHSAGGLIKWVFELYELTEEPGKVSAPKHAALAFVSAEKMKGCVLRLHQFPLEHETCSGKGWASSGMLLTDDDRTTFESWCTSTTAPADVGGFPSLPLRDRVGFKSNQLQDEAFSWIFAAGRLTAGAPGIGVSRGTQENIRCWGAYSARLEEALQAYLSVFG
jgi:hypothetical protein